MFQRIMVTTDGSEFANQAIPVAEDLADRYGAALYIFRSVPDLRTTVDVVDLFRGPSDELDRRQQEMIDEAQADLERAVQSLTHRGLTVEPILEVGPAAEKILDCAAARDVDLIVMCSHGRTGLQRWRYGSVAHRVFRGAQCSMFVVKVKFPEIGEEG